MIFARRPTSPSTFLMKSPPFAASRTALVATAVMRDTPWRSASVRNAASVRTPASMACGDTRPLPRGPRPRRTLLFAPHRGAIYYSEAPIRFDLGPHHVTRIPADVDSCDAHVPACYRLHVPILTTA